MARGSGVFTIRRCVGEGAGKYKADNHVCKFDGTGSRLDCAAIRSEETADRNKLTQELWREPIRRALNSWSIPPGNQPPAPKIASPEDGSTYSPSATVPLRGSAVDPDGDPISYTWTGAEGSNVFAIGTDPNTGWVPLNSIGPKSPGIYSVLLSLSASDGSAARTEQVTISVLYPPN